MKKHQREQFKEDLESYGFKVKYWDKKRRRVFLRLTPGCILHDSIKLKKDSLIIGLETDEHSSRYDPEKKLQRDRWGVKIQTLKIPLQRIIRLDIRPMWVIPGHICWKWGPKGFWVRTRTRRNFSDF